MINKKLNGQIKDATHDYSKLLLNVALQKQKDLCAKNSSRRYMKSN